MIELAIDKQIGPRYTKYLYIYCGFVFMAKSLLRLEARKLRKKGVSVKKIAKYLKVSKSSASRWVRDIVLTVEQLENLRKSSLEGAERGRLRNALIQKDKIFLTLA